MSEKTNFIPANELPLAEGEQVEVLCLENGEMKRKPADGLGGGSGYDAMILITRDPDNEWDTMVLESGSHAEIHAKIMAGKTVSVAMKDVTLSGGVPFGLSVLTSVRVDCCSDISEPIYCQFISPFDNNLRAAVIAPDNSTYWD